MPRSKHSIHDAELPYEPEPQESPAESAIDKEAYRRRLAEALKDPEFRKIEGFPIGTDEAILALSDPPYYTACPNPFLPEIIEQWREERRLLRKELGLPDDEDPAVAGRAYKREPFAADVSEGKNDPIYNAHSYHTKVPHKAVMRYILHYTDPGDIVFDGFCGTGMTGVAAQLCGDKKAVESLGYTVRKDGVILDENGKPFSRLGARKAVLNDLSPAATFIAYNYNTPVDARAFEREARRILREVEEECGWMYETWHPHCDDPNRVKAKINYTVWSDVFVCPQCGKEMVFWDVAVDPKIGSIRDAWNCPGCASLLSKSPKKGSGALRAERAWETRYDRELKQSVRQAKQVPVLINYSLGKKRHEKAPDQADLELIRKIEEREIPYAIPKNRMPEGSESRRNDEIGLTHVHHFYTRRNLWVLAAMKSRLRRPEHFLWCTSQHINVSKLNRYRPGVSFPYNPLSGTLYISSQVSEANIVTAYDNKIGRMKKALFKNTPGLFIGMVQSSSSLINIQDAVIDYIFVDPPFGANLMYSELNFIWEAWLHVFTNNKPEAIVSKEQRKGLWEYQSLMQACFTEFKRLLKPGRWMTVEFHNSQNSVWNAIQEALLQAGFMVADVRTLDKQQGTFKQVTTTSAVKQDLVISAYKPSDEFEQKFTSLAGQEAGVWEFVRQWLENLPLPTVKGNVIEPQQERMPFLLFDRMVAFHLVRGLPIPLSSAEFYQGLNQRYLPRDGMFFTSIQAQEYDAMRMKAERVEQMVLFVTDEQSAIQWLRQDLDEKNGTGPQTYSDLQPRFFKQLHQSRHEKLPELLTILEQNFLQDEQGRWYVPDPDRQADLEKLRNSALLREFHEYTRTKGRLKAFRSEAVRAGFSKAWKERDYDTIVAVAERLPEQVLQEDASLKMYYDNALGRAARKPRQAKLL